MTDLAQSFLCWTFTLIIPAMELSLSKSVSVYTYTMADVSPAGFIRDQRISSFSGL